MRLFVFSLLMAFTVRVAAEPAKKAQVTADSAEVYASPSFKAEVIDHLKQGAIVKMATHKVIGNGGLGVFYKIKTPGGKVGYITDSDITTAITEPAKSPAPSVPVDNSKLAKEPDRAAEKPAPAAPMGQAQASMWGLSAEIADYGEKFFGTKVSHSQLFAGVRRIGAASSPRSWRSDFSLAISPSAPKFLSAAGAYGKTSGFVVMADVLLMIPIASWQTISVYGEAGPALAYSSYKTFYGADPFTSNESRFGGNVALGAGYQDGRWALLGDVKFHIEKTSYLSERLSLLFAF
jgi:hypothetical protein